METKHKTQIKLFKRIVLFTAFLGIGFFFSSCFVDYGLDTTNYDMVGTFYDTTYNFGASHTYFLFPEVKKLGDGLTSSYDNTILTRVQKNLNDYGWTQSTDSTSCDVRVYTGITSSTYVVQDWYSYYGWYWYYPYYPTYSYSYTTGTVLIFMGDWHNANNTTHTLPIPWLGILNGLANGSSGTQRIQTGIDQAFLQSPYLKH
jgi:hypothetical protein